MPPVPPISGFSRSRSSTECRFRCANGSKMTQCSKSNRACLRVAVTLAIAAAAARPGHADDFVIPLEVPQVNFIGLGVGAYPDYFGSEDSRVGAAPIGRLSLGGARFVRLMVNEVRVNVLDHPSWQLGPVGLWRFGREDVDNSVVDRVHSIAARHGERSEGA